MLEIYLDHQFPWPQKSLNCQSLAYEVVTLCPSRLGNYFVCNRFAVQTFLWSLEFVIQKNLQRDTILAWNVVWSLNISAFNMINGINESKKLAKHILFKFRDVFGGRKCKLRQKWNTDKCQCECKKLNKILCMWRRLRRESWYICLQVWRYCEIGKSLKNRECTKCLVDDLVVTCDEIV